ncbi:MAG: carboxylesterase [Methylococcaceae bacterium]|nr:carboxylesterase [Methylococcaceae bacterium]
MTTNPLDVICLDPSTPARRSVIWLHGLGADGHDFEPLVPELGLVDRLAVRFVFPHAPYRPITINGGYVMRGWYDIAAAEIDRKPDLAGILASAAAVTALLEQEIARGIPPERIVVAGFSQGGLIALEVGGRFREPLAGVIALSTYLADASAFPEARQELPVFIGHGRFDDIVPLRLGELSRDSLPGKGYRVTWRDYPMPHSVCAEEIADIAHWMEGVFGG